jgi:membrane-associated protein
VHLVLTVVHYALHLDSELPELIARYGQMIYAILFAIIFAETGFVVTPFLPGDSLIFVAGAMAATTAGLNAPLLFVLLSVAAILGNTANYWVGRFLGPRVFHWEHSRWFNRHALDETHAFYTRYGSIAITAARFIPIVRTFAPFVAGVGAMSHARFQLVNILSALAWVAIFVVLGYFFGNLDVVKHNLMFIMVAVILISVTPAVVGGLRARARVRARQG